MDKKIYEIDVRGGLPDEMACLRILEYEFASAYAIGERVIKVIHGSGSTGRGCASLRTEVRRWGRDDSRVHVTIKGENFTVERPQTRYLVENFPYVANDPDLEKANPEITIFFVSSMF